jgi:hypothetical protein
MLSENENLKAQIDLLEATVEKKKEEHQSLQNRVREMHDEPSKSEVDSQGQTNSVEASSVFIEQLNAIMMEKNEAKEKILTHEKSIQVLKKKLKESYKANFDH